MAAAQLASLGAALIISPVAGGLILAPIALLEKDVPERILRTALLAAGCAAALLPFGFILASYQGLFLARWITRVGRWRGFSALAGMFLLPGVVFLAGRMAFPPPGQLIPYEAFQASRLAARTLFALSFAGGFLDGAAGGLLFGLVQGRFLARRARAWQILSALGWGLAAGLLLGAVNASAALYPSGAD